MLTTKDTSLAFPNHTMLLPPFLGFAPSSDTAQWSPHTMSINGLLPIFGYWKLIGLVSLWLWCIDMYMYLTDKPEKGQGGVCSNTGLGYFYFGCTYTHTHTTNSLHSTSTDMFTTVWCTCTWSLACSPTRCSCFVRFGRANGRKKSLQHCSRKYKLTVFI